jgi:hypothetical protein
MGKGSNLAISLFIILILCIGLFYTNWYKFKPAQQVSDTAIQNRLNDNLRIDTIVMRYDSLIYKTKVKTHEKIIFIYMWPDSILIDSIKSGLQQFDSIGNAKNTIYHGTEQKH